MLNAQLTDQFVKNANANLHFPACDMRRDSSPTVVSHGAAAPNASKTARVSSPPPSDIRCSLEERRRAPLRVLSGVVESCGAVSKVVFVVWSESGRVG